jgi:glycosyltransferase involved in cell wall biosynthesis
MSQLTVGLLSTWDTVCGIADFSSALRNALVDRGINVGVVRIDRQELALMSRSELTEEFVRLSRALGEYDVAHIQHEFGFFLGSYGMPASINMFGHALRELGRLNQPTLITFHTAPPFVFGGARRAQMGLDHLMRVAWRTRVATHIDGKHVLSIAQSRFLRKTLLDSGLKDSALKLVLPGAPPPSTPMSDGSVEKQSLNYDQTTRLLAIVGFVSGYKGHLVAARAMKYLPREYCLAVVGGPHPDANDDTFDRLLEFKRKHDKANRIRITGYVTPGERALYLRAADIILAPYVDSRLAASGSILWALSAAKPVVASSIPLFREIDNTANCMVLTTPYAAAELAHRVEELDGDSQKKEALVKNASAHLKQISWERTGEAYERHYRGLLTKHVG